MAGACTCLARYATLFISTRSGRAWSLPAGAATYPWISLPKWPDRKRPAWLCPTTVLSESGGLPDTKAGWRRYGTYLEFLATDEQMKRELVAKRLSRGWCVGARSFKQEFRKDQAPERR